VNPVRVRATDKVNFRGSRERSTVDGFLERLKQIKRALRASVACDSAIGTSATP
jgi:hypothetical protein